MDIPIDLLNKDFWKNINNLIKTIDSFLKFSALFIIVVSAVFVVLIKQIENKEVITIITYAYPSLCALTFLSVFVKGIIYPKTSFSQKIDEGGFEIYDDSESPAAIWQNFCDEFRSFNDSWIMEMNSPNNFLTAHKERYKDPECGTFRFLFFIKDSIDAFERFVKFQAMVHLDFKENQTGDNFKDLLANKIEGKELPDTLNHIYVYLNKDIIPRQTFFIGFKKTNNRKGNLQKVSIWYLSLPGEKGQEKSKLQYAILKSTNEDFWLDLKRRWEELRIGSETISGKDVFRKYLEISLKEGKL